MSHDDDSYLELRACPVEPREGEPFEDLARTYLVDSDYLVDHGVTAETVADLVVMEPRLGAPSVPEHELLN